MTSEGTGRPFRDEIVTLALALIVQATAVALLVQTWQVYHQSLGTDGPWVSTKTTLARPVPGTMAFVTDRQTLAGGYLNLHAWHGFHEVVSRSDFERPLSLEFDFGLGENAYLVVLTHQLPEGGWDALRLSSHPGHPSALLRIGPDGAFREKRPIAIPPLQLEARTAAAMTFSGRDVSITIDDRHVGTFPLVTTGRTRIGFRGGVRPAAVDDVRLVSSDGTTFVESFDAAASGQTASALAVAIIALLTVFLFRGLYTRRRIARWPLGFYFLASSLVLLAGAGSLRGLSWVLVGRYPAVHEERMRAEERYRWDTLADAREEIRARYAARHDPGVYRILLVGGSQTWGQGATRDEDILAVALRQEIERRSMGLSAPGADAGKPRVECILGAAPGARAEELLQALQDDWLDLEPDVVVFNLSSNDMETGSAFANQVRAMVEAARGAGARSLLVKEPHSPSAVPEGLRRRHLDLDRVAAATGVPVFDLHGYLRARDDDGFLWWDMVHLTSLGQRYAAESLATELARLGDIP
jgi:lysophospholipase L1-like esterase